MAIARSVKTIKLMQCGASFFTLSLYCMHLVFYSKRYNKQVVLLIQWLTNVKRRAIDKCQAEKKTDCAFNRF